MKFVCAIVLVTSVGVDVMFADGQTSRAVVASGKDHLEQFVRVAETFSARTGG